ncbi:unnamed protein product [Adineta ricciae]|uniref:Uncharacterized protein n=1 Tax=Adineta ricciae TaxID=249248 RepID=A0A814PT75_ADIRI|nr:unnamed protein product [Adineta ricciae]
MVLREVPIEISADDQHLQVRRPAAPTCGMSHLMCYKRDIPSKSKAMPRLSNFAPMSSNASARMDLDFTAAPRGRRESHAKNIPIDVDNGEFPSGDEDIVRYLIDKQNFDGLWSVDSDIIQKLTGKSLTQFQYSAQKELIISAIIIILLETRFSSYSSMCSGIIQKSKKRILDLLNKDQNQFQSLFDGIRQQL